MTDNNGEAKIAKQMFIRPMSSGKHSQSEDQTVKSLLNIMRMSSDPRVQHYLRVLLLENDTRLRFQIIGGLAIKQRKIELPNGIVLEPHPSGSLDGKKVNEITHEEWKQLYEQEYVIDGYIDVGLRPAEDIAQQVASVVERIEGAVNLLSFYMRAKLRWIPTQPVSDSKGNSIILPATIETRDSVHPEKGHIASFIGLFQQIESLPEQHRVDMYRAIDWFQQGINSLSVFNQFLSFWLAIETLARSLYPRVKDKTGKTQIRNAFCKLLGDEAHEKVEKCFGEKEPLIGIRIDIAHGKISESDTAQKSRVQKRIYEIQQLAKDFLLNTLRTIGQPS